MTNKIIHIGYPKSASTWLKKNFFPLSSQFQQVEENVVVDHIIRPYTFTFNSAQQKAFFDKNYEDNIIISESMLSGSLVMTGNNGVYTKEICSRLKAIFPDAQIIIFIRNQPDIIASSYLEYIKKGGSYNINRYLWRTINIPLEFRFEFFEYDLIIDHYYKSFGESNVHVFCYEHFAEDPANFVTKLINKFNLGISMEHVDLTTKNFALQQNLYPIIRFLNHFTRKGVFLKRYIVDLPYPRNFSNRLYSKLNDLKIFGGKPDTGKILGSRNLSILNQYYKKSNQKLTSMLKPINLKELGYPL